MSKKQIWSDPGYYGPGRRLPSARESELARIVAAAESLLASGQCPNDGAALQDDRCSCGFVLERGDPPVIARRVGFNRHYMPRIGPATLRGEGA